MAGWLHTTWDMACDCINMPPPELIYRDSSRNMQQSDNGPLTRYAKLQVAHAPGMPGTFSPPLRVSDPDMHHSTNVTPVPWCMPGSLTSSSPWSRWLGKHSRHSRCMRYLQFYVSGKRPMAWRRIGKTHYLNRWWSRSLVPNNVIKTQWVNRCNLVN